MIGRAADVLIQHYGDILWDESKLCYKWFCLTVEAVTKWNISLHLTLDGETSQDEGSTYKEIFLSYINDVKPKDKWVKTVSIVLLAVSVHVIIMGIWYEHFLNLFRPVGAPILLSSLGLYLRVICINGGKFIFE